MDWHGGVRPHNISASRLGYWFGMYKYKLMISR